MERSLRQTHSRAVHGETCVQSFRSMTVCALLQEPQSQHSMMSDRTEGRRNTGQLWGGGLSILQQECISKIYNQVQKDPNWIYSVIPLLLMYVCTPMKPNRKAHSKLLTLPRTNALQCVNPPTGSQKHIFIHTCTLTCDTAEEWLSAWTRKTV